MEGIVECVYSSICPAAHLNGKVFFDLTEEATDTFLEFSFHRKEPPMIDRSLLLVVSGVAVGIKSSTSTRMSSSLEVHDLIFLIWLTCESQKVSSMVLDSTSKSAHFNSTTTLQDDHVGSASAIVDNCNNSKGELLNTNGSCSRTE